MANEKGKIDPKRIIPVMKKEFLHIVRDARSLGIVLVAPIALLVLYAYAVTFDIKKIDLGVVDYDQSSLSRTIIQKFTASGYFEVYGPTENDMKKCAEALKLNRIKMILTLPENLLKDIKKNKTVKLQVIGDGSDSNTINTALGYASQIIAAVSHNIMLNAVQQRGFNPSVIPMVEPVPRVWYNPNLASTNYIVPGLSAIIMMLVAAMLTSLTVVREKENGTFEQLISTPIKAIELIAGKLVPYILLCFIDVALIVLVGIFWFKVPFHGNVLTLVLFTLLFLFCALGMGLFISAVAPNQQIAVVGTAFGTLLPSFLLSGFVFPIDSMPWILQAVTYFMPARYFITALRTIFLKADTGIMTLWNEAFFLFVFGMFFMLVAAKRFRKDLG